MSGNYDESARLLEAARAVSSSVPLHEVGLLHNRAIGFALLALHDRLDQFFTEVVAVLETAKTPNGNQESQ